MTGAIQVDSGPDRGTTVRVFLPALAAALAPETPADACAGSGTCILVVEDEKHILEIVKLVLGQRQYRILVAHDVPQARALYDQAGGRVDLLISDMVLTKDGDGISLANQLRQRQPRLGGGADERLHRLPNPLAGRCRTRLPFSGQAVHPGPLGGDGRGGIGQEQADNSRNRESRKLK